jgi:hypothetical protein
MGLDQYLEARKYVSKFDYSEGFDNKKISGEYEEISKFAPADFDKHADFGGINISYPVGYWRKANAIHGWVVENLADGVDECQPIYVSREKLVELRDLCKTAVSQPAMAGDILPPTQGFFFGGYEIDEYYMEDLNRTVEMIDHILEIIPEDDYNWSFIYQASW